MSMVPEEVIEALIVRGVRLMRDDIRYVHQLFRHLPRRAQDQIANFVRFAKFFTSINFPRVVPVPTPAIIIVLQGETESQGFVGDSQGVARTDDGALMPFLGRDGPIPPDVLDGTASVAPLDSAAPRVWNPTRVSSAGPGYLEVAEDTWWPQKWEHYPTEVAVHTIGGTGAGQTRDIVTTGRRRLDITPNWFVVPDSTTVFEIRQKPTELLGEARRVYDSGDTTVYEERGSEYRSNYQIQVIETNERMTIYLATMIKALLTISRRDLLEREGLKNLTVAATDLARREEYVPEDAYMRALNVSFEHTFTTITPMSDLAQAIRVRLFAPELDDPFGEGSEIDLGPQPPAIEG